MVYMLMQDEKGHDNDNDLSTLNNGETRLKQYN